MVSLRLRLPWCHVTHTGVQDITADHVASHLGKAETIAMLLRAAPYYRSRRRVPIPMDVLMRVSHSIILIETINSN